MSLVASSSQANAPSAGGPSGGLDDANADSTAPCGSANTKNRPISGMSDGPK